MLAQVCQRIAESRLFQGAILVVIGLASILVGLETFDDLTAQYGELFSALDALVLGIFTLEILIRIGAYGRRPWAFFRDGWNVFDFLTVVIFYMPFVGSEAALLRLARVLRVLRLVKAVPGLRLLVAALLHSLPSISYIGLLLLIQIYAYAVVGSFVFGETDPEHFGNVAIAMRTLMQVITFDDWAAIMRAQSNQVAAVIYFVTFILTGTMVVLNLFIGVITDGFTSAREQFEAERQELAAVVQAEQNEVEAELQRIHAQLNELTHDMDRLVLTTQRARTALNGATSLPDDEEIGPASETTQGRGA